MQSVSAELRQLSEGYKAKAERLGAELVSERESAAARSELWKQQLSSLRQRSKNDREHARQLAGRLQQLMQQQQQRDGLEGASPFPATPATVRGSYGGRPSYGPRTAQSERSEPSSASNFRSSW